jgi:hypothetical protein
MYHKPRRRMEIAGINEKETGDAWALVNYTTRPKTSTTTTGLLYK